LRAQENGIIITDPGYEPQDPVTELFALIPDVLREIVRQEPQHSILSPLTIAHASVGNCGSRKTHL
jgi:hypothetical protein